MKIINYIKLFSITLLGLSLFSCQKVIDVDLNEADSRLVIEGNITPEPGRNKVMLSTSGGYFDNSAVQPVENGIVKVTDENGNSEILEESTEPGTYYSNNLVGVLNMNYSIEVTVDGEVYSGSDYLPPIVPIDTLYYEIDDFVPPGNDEEGDRYDILLTLSDPIDTLNYYRIVTYVNSELVYGGFSPYRVLEDELIDGLTFTLTIRGTEAQLGDTVIVELQSIGANTYEYYTTLNDTFDGGGLGSTPYNPKTNLNNGALGYFGAYSFSKAAVVIEE